MRSVASSGDYLLAPTCKVQPVTASLVLVVPAHEKKKGDRSHWHWSEQSIGAIVSLRLYWVRDLLRGLVAWVASAFAAEPGGGRDDYTTAKQALGIFLYHGHTLSTWKEVNRLLNSTSLNVLQPSAAWLTTEAKKSKARDHGCLDP